MNRDIINANRNDYLRRNYDKIKPHDCNIDNSVSSQRVRQTNNNQRNKTDRLSAIANNVAALTNSGLTQRQISELLGVSLGSINKIIHLISTKSNT